MRNRKDARDLSFLRNQVDLLSLRLDDLSAMDPDTIRDMLRRISSLEAGMKSGKSILTSAELAEYLNVSRSHVYKMVRNGRIPHYRTFRKLFFERDRIDEWVRNNTKL